MKLPTAANLKKRIKAGTPINALARKFGVSREEILNVLNPKRKKK